MGLCPTIGIQAIVSACEAAEFQSHRGGNCELSGKAGARRAVRNGSRRGRPVGDKAEAAKDRTLRNSTLSTEKPVILALVRPG